MKIRVSVVQFRPWAPKIPIENQMLQCAFAPFVRPTPQSDPWRHDRARIVS